MANVITELPARTRKGTAGRAPKYPYEEWCDGQIRELVEGEDYTAKSNAVLAGIRKQAERRGLNVRSVTTDTGFAFQCVPLTEMPKQVRSKNGKKAGK